jgi:hypothetical protein
MCSIRSGVGIVEPGFSTVLKGIRAGIRGRAGRLGCHRPSGPTQMDLTAHRAWRKRKDPGRSSGPGQKLQKVCHQLTAVY